MDSFIIITFDSARNFVVLIECVCCVKEWQSQANGRICGVDRSDLWSDAERDMRVGLSA